MGLDDNYDSSSFRSEVKPIFAIDLTLFLLGVISLVFNVIMIYIAGWRRRTGWPIDVILFLMVGFLDVISSIFIVTSQIWKWVSDYSVIIDGSIWCRTSSIIVWSTTFSALNITALLSLVRYLVIVREYDLKTKIWSISAVLIILISCSVFFVKDYMSIPRVFPSGLYCASLWGGNDTLSIFFYIAIIILALPPLIVIPLCYYCITSHYLHYLSQVNPLDLKGFYLHERVSGLIAFGITYIITLIPEYLQAIISFSFDLKLISWIDGVSKSLFFSVSIVNALFTLLFHDDTNREFSRWSNQLQSNRLFRNSVFTSQSSVARSVSSAH